MFKISKISLPFLLVSGFFVGSCSDTKSALDKEVAQVPMEVVVERFDQAFYKGKAEDFQALKTKYPYLFPAGVSDQAWLEKKQDTIFQELYEEVDRQYSDLKELPAALKGLFQYMKFYFPEESSQKKVITVISEVDVSVKAIYADSLALISLDTYLGKEHHFYKGFPLYTHTTFEPSQILPDMAESFVIQKLPKNKDRTFLAAIIQQGKLVYAKEALLPSVPKETLMTYTKEELGWCIANESQVWRYFIDNQLLFDTDGRLPARFIEPAPFSKFYLDIDSESPGRVGVWIGWQIVRSFMENNNVTLQELFAMNAKDIFEKSKYKPKK